MYDLLSGLNGGSVPTLELVYLLTLVALLPSIVIMMTSFTRIIIILSFTRNAMGVQGDTAQYGFGRYRPVSDTLYHGSHH